MAILPAILAILFPASAKAQEAASPAATNETAPRIVFVGNSFTFGAGSPVRLYRAETVNDLNGEGIGGVPALFKMFSRQAGRDFDVSLETAAGKNLDFHVQNKAAVLDQHWDFAVLQGHSMLDPKKPGDPALLAKSGRELTELLRRRNPKVEILLVATWSRADQVYPKTGHWHGKPIEQMARDVRTGYNFAAAAAGGAIHDVIPVGEAWNRAFRTGVADPNPYDGISARQLNLWGRDEYHASAFGYYLEALMIFGDLTGLDPRSLGKNERAAWELGFSPEQASALQQVAFDELSATKGRAKLQPFKPANLRPPISSR
ncbi:MAG: PEP-CTERM sorting domain-containing protein [Chthoniobacterales bacterium]|nr:PEP-CTERM sorting domain-containing protein [Chthoniobacterales bacterium]